MDTPSRATLARVLSSCLKLSHKKSTIYRLWIRLRTPPPPYINDHYARDIGLSLREKELLRLRYPSQNYTHPRL